MMLKLKVLFILFVLFCTQKAYSQKGDGSTKRLTISAPDGRIRFSVFTRNGVLHYAVDYNKTPVIQDSRMGLIINGRVLGDGASAGKMESYKLNETYPYRGVHSVAINKCNGAKINITAGASSFVLEARVFNDGIAFRYLVNNTGNATIEKDTTAFVLPAGSTVWSQPNIKYYEGRYGKKKIEEFAAGETAGPPATIVLPGDTLYAAITEGGLTDFGGMSLRADGSHGFGAYLTGTTKKTGNIASPWRIIEIGKDLNTLVNCDIIAHVSAPYDPMLFPKGYNTAWVKPGRSVWSWLADKGAVTPDNMKRFSDLAGQLGFEYNLVDEGWSNWKDSARGLGAWDLMKELVDYSAAKGVKIWAWKAYPDRRGIPGIKDSSQRREFFQRCKALGIAGLKVDFFDSEAQEIVDFYQAALKDAAAFQLMMNFHGANKPTGEARTWPNELSREAIRGLENRPPWAAGNVVLPFTRYLAGHADFTPVNFGSRLGEVSWAHQVATLVIFTSPFLCLGADPQQIIDNPAKELIQSVPPVWDETIVLPQSRIGELALYARRKGDTWFLAALNGVHEARTIQVDLSFLKGDYRLYAMKDDPAKQANAVLENSAASSKTLTINLNPEGGFVGRFDKK